MRTFSSKLKVIGPTFAAGAVLSALVVMSSADKMGWSFGEAVGAWASVVAGPFAGLWGVAEVEPVGVIGGVVVCCMYVANHPLRPGWGNGLLSVLGVFLWLVLGFMLTYDLP